MDRIDSRVAADERTTLRRIRLCDGRAELLREAIEGTVGE